MNRSKMHITCRCVPPAIRRAVLRTQLGATALLVAGAGACTLLSDPVTTVLLPLRSVDGRNVPTQIGSGAGAVVVAEGQLVGSDSDQTCAYIIRMATNAVRTGQVQPCSARRGDSVTVRLDLGGGQFPVGQHEYHFAR